MGKTAAVLLSLFTGDVSNCISLWLVLKIYQPFKFALAFSMLQVSSSYSHKHKNKYEIKVWPRKKLYWIRKTHNKATHYCSNMWLSFSNTGISFLFALKTSKSQPIVWLSVWKSWALVLKQILGQVFW